MINQHTVQVTEIVVHLSTTENLKLFEDDLEGHQNLPLKENKLKGVIIVDIELVAAKSYKSPDYSRWNGWQSIVIEFEYGDDWMDKADDNSQCLETYDTMHQEWGCGKMERGQKKGVQKKRVCKKKRVQKKRSAKKKECKKKGVQKKKCAKKKSA